jgi:HK97 gp10 family phage protein
VSSGSSEIRRLVADLKGAEAASRVMIRRAIQKTCADTKADAQSLAPVDTGALKSSITYETRAQRNSIVGEVGPTVDYGMFVEAGTSRMGPQPYMRPAFDRRAPILEQILEQLKPGDI